MPIGGFVISIDPSMEKPILKNLERFGDIEIHGTDDSGNIVAVIDTATSDEMEKLVKTLSRMDGILTVGLTYFNAEDEIEKIEAGEFVPKISFGKKNN
ncbi:MAG TPA: hypothetical protein EYP57_00115 [Thermodesulfobacteriaceae bacterium]|nr:hypothetical protein [Thermodesulfobacteriaceae bacterium]